MSSSFALNWVINSLLKMYIIHFLTGLYWSKKIWERAPENQVHQGKKFYIDAHITVHVYTCTSFCILLPNSFYLCRMKIHSTTVQPKTTRTQFMDSSTNNFMVHGSVITSLLIYFIINCTYSSLVWSWFIDSVFLFQCLFILSIHVRTLH